jgi:hypothetical protein
MPKVQETKAAHNFSEKKLKLIGNAKAIRDCFLQTIHRNQSSFLTTAVSCNKKKYQFLTLD